MTPRGGVTLSQVSELTTSDRLQYVAGVRNGPRYIQLMTVLLQIFAVAPFFVSSSGRIVVPSSEFSIELVTIAIVIIGVVLTISSLLVRDAARRHRAEVKLAKILRGHSTGSLKRVQEQVARGVLASSKFDKLQSIVDGNNSSDSRGSVDRESDQIIAELLEFFENDPLGDLARQPLLQPSRKGRVAYFDHATRPG
jgi:hypothetical protein